jgi:maltokinase
MAEPRRVGVAVSRDRLLEPTSIDLDLLVTDLSDRLRTWMAGQRWYGGAGATPRSVVPVRLEPLRDEWPMLLWCPALVTGSDGAAATYQLLLGLDPEPADRVRARIGGEVIGTVTIGDDLEVTVYPALADESLRTVLAAEVAPDVEVRGSVVLSGDHSNSSIVFDDRWLLKLYRRLGDGPNPDSEVPVALGAAGFGDVTPVPVGVWQRHGWDLAVMRPFLPAARDGQEVMAASIDECLTTRRAPHELELDPEPGSLELGATVARMHLGLAAAFGSAPLEPAALRDLLVDRLAAARADGLDVAGIEAVYTRLSDADDLGAAVRVHGDLHLGQVLSEAGGWRVVDFEGEPTRPLPERRRASSPLRDVAGMIRSYSYVAELALLDHGVTGDPELEQRELVVLAEAWEERAVAAFVAGYTAVAGIDALLPDGPESRDALVAVFELDKALYELAYETGHRPHLAPIPRRAVVRLTTSDHHRRW